MKFVAFSPTVALSLIAGVAFIIIVLYLLRPSPQRLMVASLLLWSRVRIVRKRIDARRLVLLLLGLAAGLSLALALTQPQIPAFGAQRLVLILDNSWSMATRSSDGLTRWQHALAEARALIEGSRAEVEVRLVDTAGRRSGSGFLGRDKALAALEELAPPSWRNARIAPLNQIDGTQIHLFTDGVAQLEVPERTTVHSVFEQAQNIAVTAFSTRPLLQDPMQYQALVQLLNASREKLRARLLITGNDEFVITQDLDLGAGETVNATFDVTDFAGGVLGAVVVSEHDALPADDLSFAVVPRHRVRRVLLVTSGNPPLEDALARLPGVELKLVRPNGYTNLAEYEAVIYDRVAPAEPPAIGSLLFRPPARDWLAKPAGVVVHPRVASWDESHAIVGGIAWRDLILSHATLLAVSGNGPDENGFNGLVRPEGHTAAALVISGSSQARWVQVGFALEDSNFSLRPDFPVFLGKALDWIDAPAPVLTREPGYIEVALPQANVYDGSGNPVPVAATSNGIVFEAGSADVFTVSAPHGQVMVVVNASNPDFAQINRTVLPEGNNSSIDISHTGRAWSLELWAIMLLIAAMFLLLEWVVFTRPRKG